MSEACSDDAQSCTTPFCSGTKSCLFTQYKMAFQPHNVGSVLMTLLIFHQIVMQDSSEVAQPRKKFPMPAVTQCAPGVLEIEIREQSITSQRCVSRGVVLWVGFFKKNLNYLLS